MRIIIIGKQILNKSKVRCNSESKTENELDSVFELCNSKKRVMTCDNKA